MDRGARQQNCTTPTTIHFQCGASRKGKGWKGGGAGVSGRLVYSKSSFSFSISPFSIAILAKGAQTSGVWSSTLPIKGVGGDWGVHMERCPKGEPYYEWKGLPLALIYKNSRTHSDMVPTDPIWKQWAQGNVDV